MTNVPYCLADDARLEEFLGRASGVFYVCAYSVTRHYGGPQEGGWYYDAGAPIASVPVTTREQAIAELERVRALLEPDFADGPDRFSVLAGEDLSVCVSGTPAAPWPDERPRYE